MTSIDRLNESTSCFPKSDKCPYFANYEDEPDSLYCLGCQYFIRADEFNMGSVKRGNALVAHICRKDAMTPEIFRDELEPIMPWE
jgi:hypothetical protein